MYSTCISNIIVNTQLLFTFCTSRITYDVSCAGPHPHRPDESGWSPVDRQTNFTPTAWLIQITRLRMADRSCVCDAWAQYTS